jgi:hypothetical protein
LTTRLRRSTEASPIADGEARAARVREYGNHPSWRFAPGAWVVQQADYPSKETIDALRQRLKGSVLCDPAVVVDTIGFFIVDYRLWSRQTTSPAGRAFRRWAVATLTKLTEMEEWLSRDPLPQPRRPLPNGDALEQMTWHRQVAAREVQGFREFLCDTYDPARPKGRPIDRCRADLVECIGTTLHLAGVRPTTSDQGLFAHVVTIALSEVGLHGATKAGQSLRQTLRAAVANHKEWMVGNPARPSK